MPAKRQVLDVLSRDELAQLVEEFPDTDMYTTGRLEQLRLPAIYMDEVFSKTTAPPMPGMGDVLYAAVRCGRD